MELTIRRLDTSLIEDYLSFFDNSFCDHEEWSWCYCTFYCGDFECEEKNQARETARRLITEGKISGYLAYAQGETVGWCNASTRESYPRLENDGFCFGAGLRVKSIVCFLIRPDKRRSGIASALLERVLRDAREEGYDVVEAYPSKSEPNQYSHYHGFPLMYEREGFTEYKNLEKFVIIRKNLGEILGE